MSTDPRLERHPTKPPISPVAKWLIIGFLGTMAMFFLFLGFLFFRFSPIVKLDSEKEQLTILGGLIQIDGQEGKVVIGGEVLPGSGNQLTSEGTITVQQGQSIAVLFSQGRLEITTSDEADKFHWECRTSGAGSTPPAPQTAAGEVRLDLKKMPWARCELAIPEKANLRIDGSNGKIEATELKYNLAVELANGKVILGPEPGRAYRYDLAVSHGKLARFDSSNTPNALKIRVRLDNGKIDQASAAESDE